MKRRVAAGPQSTDDLVLDALRREGPLSVVALSKTTGVLQPTVRAAVNRLRDEYLVGIYLWGRGPRGAPLFEAKR